MSAEVEQAVAQGRAPTSWLTQPRRAAARAVGSVPRHHLVILALITCIGFARGFFWVLTTEVWSPIDEAQHYAYVDSLATGNGIPIVGEDLVPNDVLYVWKATPTFWFHSSPLQPTTADGRWGATAQQYEGGGVQGPLYYMLMTLPYWLLKPFGILWAIYAMRITSVLVSLLTIPLTWLLAREIFPQRPAVWLAAPALVVLVEGFNANVAAINNDALMIPISTAALIPMAQMPRGLTMKQASLGGTLFGLAFLTKGTTLALAPLLGLMLAIVVLQRREPLSKVFRWTILYGAVAGAVVAPYFLWNLLTYGALSASEQVLAITGPVQGYLPFTAEAIRIHWTIARTGFWEYQLYSPGPNSYTDVFEWAAIAAFLIGAAVAAFRRDLLGLLMLVWLGAAFPLAFLTKLAMTYALFEGVGSGVGRHMYVALAPLCILIAAGFIRPFGARWGSIALVAIAAIALGREPGQIQRYVDVAYASGIIDGNLVPAAEQTWNDGYTAAEGVRFDPPCPVEVVGLGIDGAPPPQVTLADGAASQSLQLTGTFGNFALYALNTPRSQPFVLNLPSGTPIGSSKTEREPRISLVNGAADPLAQMYCRTEDPKASRFSQRYDPQHPKGLTYDRVQTWATGWAWLARAALVGTVAGVILIEAKRRLERRGRPTSGASETIRQ